MSGPCQLVHNEGETSKESGQMGVTGPREEHQLGPWIKPRMTYS